MSPAQSNTDHSTNDNASLPPHLDPSNYPQTLATPSTHTELRYAPLDIPAALAFTRSPSCGANVLFLGTTRNTFDDRPVTRLSYSSYPALALRSLSAIAEDVRRKHDGLEKVYIAHRLGEVGIGEESIAVSVSSKHRSAGWKGAEEVLERVKARAEIWKREWFGDGVGVGGEEEGVWRANRDTDGTGKLVEDQRRGQDGLEQLRAGVENGNNASSIETGATDENEQIDKASTKGCSGIDPASTSTAAHTAGSEKKTYQTSEELDNDVADYIAALTKRIKP